MGALALRKRQLSVAAMVVDGFDPALGHGLLGPRLLVLEPLHFENQVSLLNPTRFSDGLRSQASSSGMLPRTAAPALNDLPGLRTPTGGCHFGRDPLVYPNEL